MEKNYEGLNPKEIGVLEQSDFAWSQMKGAKNKLDTCEGELVDLTKERKKTTKRGRKGSLMIYTYAKYGEVQLFCLKEPLDGYLFVVSYEPLSWYYGFKTWQDAHNFAKSQGRRVNGLNWMLGG